MNEERMRVLEMVREGKITADEGVRLLEALKVAGGASSAASGSSASGASGASGEHETRGNWNWGGPRGRGAWEHGGDDPVSRAVSNITSAVGEALESSGFKERFKGSWGGHWGGPLRGQERRREREADGWQYVSLSEGTHGTFDLPEGAKLRLESEAGSIQASAAEGGARVDLEGEDTRNFDVYAMRKDDEFVVAAHRTDHEAKMPRLVVSVPRTVAEVAFQTAGGGIKAHGFSCPVRLKTAGGGINVEGQGTGNVEAKTAGGGIDVDGTPNEVTLHTAGGGIRFHGRTNSLDAKTAGGSITIDGVRLTSGRHQARTAGGSVRVRLSRDSSVEVDAATNAGGINVDLPGARGSYSGSRISPRYHGTFNGSGAHLELRTVGGSVAVGVVEESAGDQPGDQPSEPDQPSAAA
jgi:hypothetical protein